MCAAVRLTLAFCVLQTLLRLANSQNDETQLQNNKTQHQNNGAISLCKDNPLNIVTKSHVIDLAVVFSIYRVNEREVLNIEHGTPLRVTCSGGNVTRLSLTKDGAELKNATKNEICVQWSTTPDAPTSEYVCVDTETACQVSVTVKVTPGFTATLPNPEYAAGQRIIQYGKTMSLQCSGFDADRLVITKDGQNILTEKISETAIKWTGNPGLQKSEYICTDVVTTYSRNKRITVEPMVYIQSQNKTIKQYYFDSNTLTHVYRLIYGDSIEVFCSGQRPVELINLEEERNEVFIENVNETTVKSSIRVLRIGGSTYSCVDSEVSDYISKVRLEVVPRIDVTSPNGRRVGEKYVMKYGDPLEIYCSGSDAEQLTLSKNRPWKTSTRVRDRRINETTIKWVTNESIITQDFLDYDAYVCAAEEAESRVVVNVDTLPETVDFRCISHNLEYLNCSWTAVRYTMNFTLFHTENGNVDRICAKVRSFTEGPRFCIWYRDDYPSYTNVKELSFLMQSCNDLGCTNQTFLIDHQSIRKVAPLIGLRVHNTTSRGAVLHWTPTYVDFFRPSRNPVESNCEHKLEYSYLGGEPVQVKLSPVLCNFFKCEIELKLPCPGQTYQVRVYQRLKTAIGEEFWSEPSSVSVDTAADSNE